ncbi:TPA: bifunctional 3,4-dihydroxy-2-butanone-4-phosphate synthase/GTP cyclohydrolase II, partial [Streptococcus agalactiae]
MRKWLLRERRKLMAFSPIKKLLQDIKSGKMVVLMDDENRENEG